MTFSGGPYITLDVSNIGTTGVCTLPFNIPFERLINALDDIAVMAHSAYVPWEWWIDYDDGEIHFGSAKGSDKSSSIKFVAKNVAFPNRVQLGRTRHSQDTKKTVQRCRVIGKSRGRRQDEISSNWQEDEDAMEDDIGSFYEEIISEKMVTNRETSNLLANINVEKKKSAIVEVEVTIEQDPYPAGSWDVGDWVTIYDPKANISSGSYRIKKIDYWIDDRGERIILTVTNAWEDITDKLADLYRRLEKMETSTIEDETWSDEKTGNIDADKVDSPWKITRKYEEEKQIVEVDPDNSDTYDTSPAALPDCGQDVICGKDELTIEGQDGACAAGQKTVDIWTVVNDTNWNFEPKFKVKLQITGEFYTDDALYFGIYYRAALFANWRGFGFNIIESSGAYKIYAVCMDGTAETRYIGTISVDELHEFEANVDWDEGYIFYHMDGNPVAVICFDKISSVLHLMTIRLFTNDRETGQSIVEFYDWTTQVLSNPRKKG